MTWFSQGFVHKGLKTHGPLVLTYQTTTGISANQPWSYTNVPLGAAALDRWVIFFVHTRNNGVLNTLTVLVNGVAASLVRRDETSQIGIGLYYAFIPAGTTCTIGITSDQPMQSSRIGVWTCTGSTDITVVASGVSTVSSPSASIATAANGVAIGGVTKNGSLIAATWTNLTKRYDVQADANSNDISFGADALTTGAGPVTYSNNLVNQSVLRFLVASFAPV